MSAGADDLALLDLARAVAREGAALAVRMRAEGIDVADTKSSPTDVVTRADRATEDLLRERILAARPDDGIVGEEGDDVVGGSGVRWVLDPIDGTVNYLYGLPHWAVSVAAARGDEVVAGVVVAPVLGREYAAARGAGATRDGEPLAVRTPDHDEGAWLAATGFSYGRELRVRQGRGVAALLGRVRDVRRAGSCALDVCAVAEGALDGYVEEGPHWWDHAAAGLVATEAGATVSVLAGPTADVVVAAPAASHARWSALVAECGLAPS